MSPAPASAQGLFQMLFGEGNQATRMHARPQPPAEVRPQSRQQSQQQQRRAAAPASLPRVSGPSYYEYRVDALVRVDFNKIELPVDQAAADRGAILVASAAGIDPSVVSSTVDAASDRSVGLGAVDPAFAADAATASRGAPVIGAVDPAFAADRGEIGAADPAFARDAAEARPAEEAAMMAPPPRLDDDALRALVEFELYSEISVAEAIVAHYSANPELVWVGEDGPSEAGRMALEVLASADRHGLNPEHYAVRTLGAGAGEAELARFEMELSARLLRYVRDVHGGRIDPNRISGYHDLAVKDIDYKAELAALSRSDDVGAYLATRQPQSGFYASLKAELAELRTSEENDIVINLEGLIRPGQTNAEFSKILKLIARDSDSAFKAEHGELLAAHQGSDHYAQELVPVIRAAQAARGLMVDGVIGPQTVRGLAGESLAGRIEKVKLAMERLRWLPSDLTDRFVFLNAPSYRAQYFEDGREKLSMRAIYGNTSRQTYFFKDRVSYVEFHPYWGVPRSILVNTYLSRLIGDPGYFDRSGFEVHDRRGQRVSSASINWGAYGANIPYDVRQSPGPRNALGELKIMFPNRHAIYMHDTPDRHLFNNINRAISNGCIRLEDPRAMAAAVLGWTEGQVTDRLAGRHSREDLDIEVPVYVAYFTAWPDDAGNVSYYDDVYSRDTRLADALSRVERLRAPSS